MSDDDDTASDIVERFLAANPSIDLIRLIHPDYGNILRGRNVTVDRLKEMAASQSSGMTTPGQVDIAFTPPGGEAHYDALEMDGIEDQWKLNWSSLRPYAVEDGMGIVTSSFVQETDSGENDCLEPRAILKRQVRESIEAGLKYKIGYEIEFHIIDRDGSSGTDSRDLWGCKSYHGPKWNLVVDIVRTAKQAGIPIWSFETEGAGMYEISTGPLDPVCAADTLVIIREIIYGLAVKANFHATFHPTPSEQLPACGLHTHLSVSNPQKNGDSVLAGILEHGPGLSAILLGGYDSVTKRELSVGALDICWGRGKHAPLHQMKERLEIRWPDNLTNPYLQLAVIIGTASLGVTKKIQLEMKPLPWLKVLGVPASHELREKLGIKHRLAKELKGRLDALKSDRKTFEAILGKKALDNYVWFREREIERSTWMEATDRRSKLSRRL